VEAGYEDAAVIGEVIPAGGGATAPIRISSAGG
jgi:hypothetical protein